MDLFNLFHRQPTEQELMQQAAQVQSQSPLDAMSAAQLGKMWNNDENYSFGIANLTLDNRRAVEEFRAKLRGYEIVRRVDKDGNELAPEKKMFGDPMMNENGVSHLCGLLESAMSKNIILSNIPKERERQVNVFCRVFGRTIIAQIAFNSERWQIDNSRRDSIPVEMSLMLWSSLMRGYDDGERRKLYPTQKNVSTQNLVHNNTPAKAWNLG